MKRIAITIAIAWSAEAIGDDAPSAYRCGAGKPIAGKGCECASGSVAARDDANVAICKPRPQPRPVKVTKIDLRVDAGTTIAIDGIARGTGARTLEVAPGRHLVELKREGYQPYSKWMELKAGDNEVVSPAWIAIEKPKPPPQAAPPPPEPAPTRVEPPVAGPPSQTLERAIKLYDKQDFYSTSIELHKVLANETGDDLGNKQRAEFFQAKTYYQMRYYTASLAMFERIANAGAIHRYRDIALKWLAALAKVLGTDDTVSVIGTYDASALADPSLQSVRDELAYLLAIHRMRAGQHDDAVALLDSIPRTADGYARARVVLGYAHFYRQDLTKALDAWASAPAGEEGDRAALAIGEAQLVAKEWDKAIAAFAKIDRKRTLGARAAWESSWAALRKRDAALDNVADRVVWARALAYEGVEASAAFLVATAHVCSNAAKADDVFARFRTKPSAIGDELARLLVDFDDNMEFYEKAVPAIRRGTAKLAPDALHVARGTLNGAYASAAFARVEALDQELALLMKADRAWQSTQVAAEILQELTVVRSVAGANAGMIARQRIERVVNELRQLERSLPATKLPLAVTCPTR